MVFVLEEFETSRKEGEGFRRVATAQTQEQIEAEYKKFKEAGFEKLRTRQLSEEQFKQTPDFIITKSREQAKEDEAKKRAISRQVLAEQAIEKLSEGNQVSKAEKDALKRMSTVTIDGYTGTGKTALQRLEARKEAIRKTQLGLPLTNLEKSALGETNIKILKGEIITKDNIENVLEKQRQETIQSLNQKLEQQEFNRRISETASKLKFETAEEARAAGFIVEEKKQEPQKPKDFVGPLLPKVQPLEIQERTKSDNNLNILDSFKGKKIGTFGDIVNIGLTEGIKKGPSIYFGAKTTALLGNYGERTAAEYILGVPKAIKSVPQAAAFAATEFLNPPAAIATAGILAPFVLKDLQEKIAEKGIAPAIAGELPSIAVFMGASEGIASIKSFSKEATLRKQIKEEILKPQEEILRGYNQRLLKLRIEGPKDLVILDIAKDRSLTLRPKEMETLPALLEKAKKIEAEQGIGKDLTLEFSFKELSGLRIVKKGGVEAGGQIEALKVTPILNDIYAKPSELSIPKTVIANYEGFTITKITKPLGAKSNLLVILEESIIKNFQSGSKLLTSEQALGFRIPFEERGFFTTKQSPLSKVEIIREFNVEFRPNELLKIEQKTKGIEFDTSFYQRNIFETDITKKTIIKDIKIRKDTITLNPLQLDSKFIFGESLKKTLPKIKYDYLFEISRGDIIKPVTPLEIQQILKGKPFGERPLTYLEREALLKSFKQPDIKKVITPEGFKILESKSGKTIFEIEKQIKLPEKKISPKPSEIISKSEKGDLIQILEPQKTKIKQEIKAESLNDLLGSKKKAKLDLPPFEQDPLLNFGKKPPLPKEGLFFLEDVKISSIQKSRPINFFGFDTRTNINPIQQPRKDISILSNIKPSLDIKPIQEIKPSLSIKPAQDISLRLDLIPAQDIILKQDLALKQDLRTDLLQELVLDLELKPSKDVFKIEPPKEKIRLFTNTFFDKTKEEQKQPGYNVQIRKGDKRGDRFITVESNLPKNRALSRGADITENFIEASFRIRPSGKSTNIQDSNPPDLSSFRRPKGKTKLSSDTYVEKRNQRINTIGEQLQLSYFKQRRKEATSGSFKRLFFGSTDKQPKKRLSFGF